MMSTAIRIIVILTSLAVAISNAIEDETHHLVDVRPSDRIVLMPYEEFCNSDLVAEKICEDKFGSTINPDLDQLRYQFNQLQEESIHQKKEIISSSHEIIILKEKIDNLTKPNIRTCPEDYEDIKGNCFSFEYTVRNWADSRAWCKQKGGDLAILNDAQLYVDLVQYMSDNEFPFAAYWVGLTDEEFEAMWVWVDGTRMSRKSPLWGWAGKQTQPNGGSISNCAVMHSSWRYQLSDAPCSNVASHICQAQSM